MRKTKLFFINFDPYLTEVLITVGATTDQTTRFIKKHRSYELTTSDLEAISISDSEEARTAMLENGNPVLILRKSPQDSMEIGYLTHEIFHIVELTFARIGIKLVDSSSEAFAYAIGHLTTCILNKVKN